jgi:hypothetical protein
VHSDVISVASCNALRLLSVDTGAKTPKGPGRPTGKRESPSPNEATSRVIRSVCEALDLPATNAVRIQKAWKLLLKRDPAAPHPSSQSAHATIDHLVSDLGLAQKDVARMFTDHPELLAATVSDHIRPITATFHQLLPLTPEHLRALLVAKPDVLTLGAPHLLAQLTFLLSLGLDGAAAAAAVAQTPELLTAPVERMQTNVAFLHGSSFTAEEIRKMMETSARWLTLGLTELTVKWAFFKQQMKGRQVDLVLWPQLLERDLISTLGPRTGFAKKKRLKLLMPSYCWGHALLNDKKVWKDSMVVPVLWYMTASPVDMCRVFAFSVDEYTRYKRCWGLTTGQQWRKQLYGTSMPASEAFDLFRKGV